MRLLFTAVLAVLSVVGGSPSQCPPDHHSCGTAAPFQCYLSSQYCCVNNQLHQARSSTCRSHPGAPAVPVAVTTKRTSPFCLPDGDVPQEVLDDSVPNGTYINQGPICLPVPFAHQLHHLVSTRNRTACLYVNPAASTSNPLPLIVWDQPSLTPIAGGLYVTHLLDTFTSASLNNENPHATGYHILTVAGLYGSHQYPTYDRMGLGWDNWYRNTNRSDPAVNADVATHDAFISDVAATGLVDTKRIYMSGWSNGASFATFYAMSTPGIAAAAVYSAPDPYRDVFDQCPNIPNPQYATPTLDIHNYCDIIGTCVSGKYFYDDLKYRYPQKETNLIIISANTTDYPILSQDGTASCDPQCNAFTMIENAAKQNEGALAHEYVIHYI